MLEGDYEPLENVKNIATFGRLSKQKNHQLIIKAFSQISNKYPDVCMKIYGEGEEEKNIRELIVQFGLVNRVRLMGNTKNVKEKMLETDIFVLSSNYEGLPNALIEAMAVGIPCISTECPTGPRDLIKNEVNGLLVPCNDTSAMASAMERLLLSYELRKKLGIAANKKIKEEYTIERIIKQLENKIWR